MIRMLTQWWLNHNLLRMLMMATIAAIAGAGFGYFEAQAEVNTSLSVPHAGNAGNAGTIYTGTRCKFQLS